MVTLFYPQQKTPKYTSAGLGVRTLISWLYQRDINGITQDGFVSNEIDQD